MLKCSPFFFFKCLCLYPNNNQEIANFNKFRVIGKGIHARLIEMIATKNNIGGDVS